MLKAVGGKYFIGNQFTLCDIIAASILCEVSIIKGGFIKIGKHAE